MPVLGLDIGKHYFRIVEIHRDKDINTLVNFGTYESRDIAFVLNDPIQAKKYAETLKAFVKDHNFGTSQVVVALPEQDVFIRTLKAPEMNMKELRNFITLGADEYIPLPLNEVTFDVQVIDKPESGNMDVLLVVSKNEVLSKYVSLIKSAGLRVAGIEPETLSIERVLGDTQDKPNAAIIVNISLYTTQIIITYKGYVRFTRSVPIGGDSLTKAIQKNLALEYSQAEEYKRAYGLDEGQVEGKVFNALSPVFDSIILEINRAKTYYTTHNPDVIINRVILSGGTALMPGLLAYIVNRLDVEAELANPWRSIKFSDKLSFSREELMQSGPIYSTAVGLALKELG